jgi:uncharacterized delta-60 repeat protein
LAVFRFNPNGSPDTGFGSGGKVIHDIQYDAYGFAGVFQPDGKIVIAGAVSAGSGIPVRFTVYRLNADGSLDTSFNSTGYNIVPHNAPTVLTKATAVALQNDGKIIAGGGSYPNVGLWGRFNGDGTLEGDGNLIASNIEYEDVAIQSDGKIVFVGSTSFNFRITRYNADKTLDKKFGNFGINTAYWGFFPLQTGSSVLIQPSGRIVVGGRTATSSMHFALARFNSNGFLDVGFGNSGRVSTPMGQPRDGINSIAQQADGKIVAVGDAENANNYDFAVARYDGSDSNTLPNRTPFDYDGDGRADISVFRPSTNLWYHLFSGNSSVGIRQFGSSGDIAAPADYDGDGRTDIAIYRPSTGRWWYLSTTTNAIIQTAWGGATDVPRPSDFDGDGKADFVLYRPSNSNWVRLGSTGQNSTIAFGIAEDKPLVGDFDGDGKGDPAVFRPSTGDWWYASSVNGQFAVVHWGANGDIPVPGDYDADGKTDFVVYRPSNGGWYILRSGEQNYTILQFGTAEDKPVAADFDGDGKADVAVWRPSTGTWYLLQTTSGFGAVQWGTNGDVPTENAFLP